MLKGHRLIGANAETIIEPDALFSDDQTDADDRRW